MHRLGGQFPNGMPVVSSSKAQHTAIIQHVLTFFKDKRLLLLLDNVSETDPHLLNLLLTLVSNRTSRSYAKFTVLLSTRSYQLAKRFAGNAVFPLSSWPTTGDTARSILCTHAAFDRDYFDDVCKQNTACMAVLEMCCGLPLALAVAGGAVKRLLASGDHHAVWAHYRVYLQNNFDQFGHISGLFKAFAECLKLLQDTRAWKAALSVDDVVSSLCIVQRCVWIPYPVLQRLWGVKRKEDIINVVRPLMEFCLVTREVRKVGVGILIPDIVLEFATHLANVATGTHKWHMKLLQSYLEETTTANPTSATLFKQEEQQYLHQHLGYHLANAIAPDGSVSQAAMVEASANELQKRLGRRYDRWHST